MRLLIAVLAAFIIIAGGLAAVIALLIVVFNIAWEYDLSRQPRRPPPATREQAPPGDGTTPGAGL